MMINPNILNEGNQMEVVEYNEDMMEMIVRCNNCGKPTKYGETRMINGFVGCDNKINIRGKEIECYFEDLMPRVIEAKKQFQRTRFKDKNNIYHTGKVYRYRDKVDGGIKNV